MCAHTSGDPMNVLDEVSGLKSLEREAQQDAPDKARFCISNVSIPTIDVDAGLGPQF
jgi:hypothetical protein